jgi:hypothetical protein
MTETAQALAAGLIVCTAIVVILVKLGVVALVCCSGLDDDDLRAGEPHSDYEEPGE